MQLSSKNKLTVADGVLYVDDKKFFSDIGFEESIVEIEDGRLVTKFRGQHLNYWMPEEITGYFASESEAIVKWFCPPGDDK